MSEDRRVIVTGSRNWKNLNAIVDELDRQLAQTKGMLTVIHGGAKGADEFADRWSKFMRKYGFHVKVEVHKAEWAKHGKAAGPIRNQKMVNSGADVVLAFPLGRSAGTRNCMRAAAEAGIPVVNLGD